MTIRAARRVQEIPPYLFAHIDKMKTEAREAVARVSSCWYLPWITEVNPSLA